MERTRWEYLVVTETEFATPDELTQRYNELGEEGWEFVSASGFDGEVAISRWKRPKDADPYPKPPG
jgi:hypothetical protein